MRIKKYIMKYVVPELEKLGFYYWETTGAPCWVFKNKEEEGFEILYQKSQLGQSLRAHIADDKRRMGIISPNEYDKQHDSQWYDYETEEELVELIKMFTQFFVEHTPRLIEEAKKPKPPEYFLTSEQNRKVLVGTKKKAQQFMLKYGLSTKKKLSEKVDQLADIIIANKSEDINQDEELLNNATAYLGEEVIRECGGEWDWDEVRGTTEIIDMNCMLLGDSVQSSIQYFWNKLDKEMFVGTYKWIEEHKTQG